MFFSILSINLCQEYFKVTVEEGRHDSTKTRKSKQLDSIEIRYYDNGNIYYSFTPDENSGLVRILVNYESGKLHTTGYMRDDYMDSTWVNFFENGDTASICIYRNNTLVKANSWDWYGKPGVVNGSGTFTTYYPDGNISSEANYVNCQIQGKSTIYYQNGKIEIEKYFKDNNLIEIIKYDEKGNVVYRKKL